VTPPQSSHARPFDRSFYAQLRERLEERQVRDRRTLAEPGGHIVSVDAGEVVRIELVAGAQIVNLLAFNSDDPDERFWAHQTCLLEGLFLGRWTRLWGTMARLRPLLTVLDETVAVRSLSGAPGAKHHPVLGGFDTPAVWRRRGGSDSAVTAWEQFAEAYHSLGLSASLIVDDACLFQKSFVNGGSVERLPSDALRGDSITLFAELDLVLLLALSPHVDGARPPAELEGISPRAVTVEVSEQLGVPLSWPYEDVSYPDMSLYVDETGARSAVPGPTRGHG
jgi:uncharacterized protein YcgI (DUF1989 family)